MSSAARKQGDGAAEADALQQEIERTREELSQTVHALVAKADVKALAQQKAAAAADRVRQQASQLGSRVSGQAGKLAASVGHGPDGVSPAGVPPLPGPGRAHRAAGLPARAVEMLPRPAAEAATRAVAAIRRNPALAGAVTAVLVAGGWALLRSRRK